MYIKNYNSSNTFRRDHNHYGVFSVSLLKLQCSNIVTLASSQRTLPDDCEHAETCWSYCNF